MINVNIRFYGTDHTKESAIDQLKLDAEFSAELRRLHKAFGCRDIGGPSVTVYGDNDNRVMNVVAEDAPAEVEE